MAASTKMEKGHTPTPSDFKKSLEIERKLIEAEMTQSKDRLKTLRQDLKAIDALIARQIDLFDLE